MYFAINSLRLVTILSERKHVAANLLYNIKIVYFLVLMEFVNRYTIQGMNNMNLALVGYVKYLKKIT